MDLLIGADFVPTESNSALFMSGDADALVGQELKKILDAAKYRVFNLEVPLVNEKYPIAKCGPNLIAATETINAYCALHVDLLALANNHVVDQDVQGLRSTCETLTKNGIAYLGAGENLAEAGAPYFIDFANKKIGVYACCEHEFGIATEQNAGANPFDPLESLDHVSKLKKQCDYVIVLYHGGKEHYRYPSPNLQKTCRKLVEKGADLVVCQHSHCIGCEEKYSGGTIVYGQGNFLFDRSINECWDTSLLIKLNENMEVSYIPLRKQENVVRLAAAEDACQIMEGFYTRSAEIKQDGFVEKKYREFANSMMDNYLFVISGMKKTFIYRVLNKLTGHRLTGWLLQKKYNEERKLMLLNFVECEAHREVIIRGLKNN